MDKGIIQLLEQRLGTVHARKRLGIERETKPRVFHYGINFFHPENWFSSHVFIRNSLRLVGLYRRGLRNTLDIKIRNNDICLADLPPVFAGYTILHISDPHVDMNPKAVTALIEVVHGLSYDLCVLTGDYRGQTYGPLDPSLAGMERLCQQLRPPIYGVLGNHDSIRMVPGLEAMGIQMLLNEHAVIGHKGSEIYLAGIDDAHYYQVDDIEKTAQPLPEQGVKVLLSHTPEIYHQAAHADFDVLLCGHTHGGQICLPGGIPVTLDSKCPRYMGAHEWRYNNMIGYTSVGAGTSVVTVRLNCPPEVTLHTLSVP